MASQIYAQQSSSLDGEVKFQIFPDYLHFLQGLSHYEGIIVPSAMQQPFVVFLQPAAFQVSISHVLQH